MIDLKLLRDDPETVRASQRSRGEDDGVVDAVRAADERRRSSLTAYERLRAQQKSMGKDVARASGEEKQALLARTKDLAAEVLASIAAREAASMKVIERGTIVQRSALLGNAPLKQRIRFLLEMPIANLFDFLL